MFNKIENKYGDQWTFSGKRHEISLIKQGSRALNTFDDKRCYIDKYISVPWGHNPGS